MQKTIVKDAEFPDVVSSLRVKEMEHTHRLRMQVPFTGSRWRKLCDVNSYHSVHERPRLRSTILSGGCLYMHQNQYHQSLRLKAVELDAGILFTDTEIAHNVEGVRLFFELDYVTVSGSLPTRQEIDGHIVMLQTCVRECLPLAPVSMFMAHVAYTDHKLKLDKKNKAFKLATGIHVVFPNIVLTTDIIKLIAQLVDCRMHKLFPLWSSAVDICAYRKDSATLRPVLSHKARKCPICTGKDTVSVSYSTKILQKHCDCIQSYIVVPYVYTYVKTFRIEQEPTMELHTTHQQLVQMSIIPTTGQLFTSGFIPPMDMGTEIDGGPNQEGIVFPTEKKHVMNLSKRKTDVYLPIGQKIMDVLYCIIRRVHENYHHVTIDSRRIIYNRKFCTILITVHGKGSRYCMVKHADHSSNRIYFIVYLRKSMVTQHCHNRDCKTHITTHGTCTKELRYTDSIQLKSAVPDYKPMSRGTKCIRTIKPKIKQTIGEVRLDYQKKWDEAFKNYSETHLREEIKY